MTSYLKEDRAGGFTGCPILFNGLVRYVIESWLRWLS